MLSVSPGRPGGNMHAPRTIRSTFAPARPARTIPLMSSASVNALIFRTTRAGSPRPAAASTCDSSSTIVRCRLNGASSSFFGALNFDSDANWRNTRSMSAVISASAVR